MSINYASSALWAASLPGSNQSAAGLYGGNFNVNGDGNFREFRTDPWGKPALVWVSKNNDVASDADGGWNKVITGIDARKKHLSVVYFRRVSDAAAGQFYHGCSSAMVGGQNSTENLGSGTINGNPYFASRLISEIRKNTWYASIGIIHESGYAGGYSGVSGIYDLSTKAKVFTSTEYRSSATATQQMHRTYLFYSTNPLDEVEWWNPGFYEMNGGEPTLLQLLSPPPTKGNWDAAWEEAAAYAPVDEVYIDTLEISNAALATPIRVCNSFEPLVAGAMTFQPFYFEITLPEVTAGSLPQMKLSIGNFSAELRAALRAIKRSNSGTSVKYRQYRIVAGAAVLGDYMDLPMPVSTIDIPSGDAMISVVCEPTNIVNLPLHRKFYTVSRFPGLRV